MIFLEDLLQLRKIEAPVLKKLLEDKTTGKNIIWATDSYKNLGPGFEKNQQIRLNHLQQQEIIKPRTQKDLETQKERTKKNAEVHTPSWITNLMINRVDEDWFKNGYRFNQESENSWIKSQEKIVFKSHSEKWKTYVRRKVLEITCGEAPFLTTRYDPSNGQVIEVKDRIGFLDRKLRIITENTESSDEWALYSLAALRSIYGYEIQGDSLLIGRLNIYLSYLETVKEVWNIELTLKDKIEIADIISWNIFQMDGLTYKTPNTRPVNEVPELNLFNFNSFDENSIEDLAYDVKINLWGSLKKVLFSEMKGRGRMAKKFDVVIGNPPYQDDNELSTRKPPVYNLFMDEAFKIGKKVELITPARFLFNAGQTPKKWNQERLSDPHFKVLSFFPNGSIIFPGTDIKGGIAITYRDMDIDFGPIGAFTAYPELNSILDKVRSVSEIKGLDTLVSNRGLYRFSDEFYKDHPFASKRVGSGTGNMIASNLFEKIPEVFLNNKPDSKNYVQLLGRENNNRIYKWIKSDYLVPNEYINKFNVLVPEANGSGALGEVLSTPLIGQPLIGHTDTFLSIGLLDNENEAQALLKYVKSKFARVLLGVLKATQHNPKSTWKFVPIQDFTSKSDIDWTKSISEIDQQLYKKYNLSPVEIDFIETHVKEMD